MLLRGGRLEDMADVAPTVSDMLNRFGSADSLPTGRDCGPISDLEVEPAWSGGADGSDIKLLSPLDLQCVKAAGVTFAASMLERVVEERAGGDPERAQHERVLINQRIGSDLALVRPGSQTAAKLKAELISLGLWSQYLEVAIGPDAEIFTKAPVLSSVGWGDLVGVRSDSAWSNPEPEIVLITDAAGGIRGAALGNDVNLRDFEGRSALLLGKAKDNNASCSIGPFFRLFDHTFGLDDVRSCQVDLQISGADSFALAAASEMHLMSRDPADLVAQVFGHHQYPDGMVLFLGTMFAPTVDRRGAAKGFTHMEGDLVRISSTRIGVLENLVTSCDRAPAWSFGISSLMRNLVERGLI